jgi:NDP-sugar pyrophosphorylase family protein
MAEVGGRPFLAYLLDVLEKAGIGDVALCTGYMGEMVKDAFGNEHGTLRLHYSQETFPLGTGGAIRFALDLLDSESVLVMNGDSYCKTDLAAFAEFHLSQSALATLLLVQSSDRGRFGQIQINSEGRVLRFDEKAYRNGIGWINAGIYLLKRDLILSIPEGKCISMEKEMFPEWISLGLYGFRCDGPFIDIGIPKDYWRAENLLRTL